MDIPKIKILKEPAFDSRNLPSLSIEAAEDLERLRQDKPRELKSAQKLSEIINKEFSWRLDYKILFRDVYFSTYNEKIEISLEKEQNPYMGDISKRLEDPSSLNKDELKSLVSFCVNLSNYSSLHEEELERMRGPCF